MNAKVEDPMGLETGIRIDMVRTVLDKTKGNIIIHGRMTACTRSVVSPDVEPDVRRCLRSAWRMGPALSPGTTSASCSCGSSISGTETRQVLL